jgi:site-specific recombinase XerD
MLSPKDDSTAEVRLLLTEYEQFLSNKAEGTTEAYLRTVRDLIEWVAQLPGNNQLFQPRQLTKMAVESYLDHLEQEGLSVSHRARVKSTISNFASFLIEEKGQLQRNPTRGIELPPVPLLAPRELSSDQRRILISLVEQNGDLRGRALFALGYWAGCRVSEVSWLQMVHTHVESKEGWLHLGYEGSRWRDINLPQEARQALYAYLQATRSNTRIYVFMSKRNGRLTEQGIHYWFRMLKAQASQGQLEIIQDLTFHDLRSDFAHRARETGWPLEEIETYLGLAVKKGTLPTF